MRNNIKHYKQVLNEQFNRNLDVNKLLGDTGEIDDLQEESLDEYKVYTSLCRLGTKIDKNVTSTY